MYNITEQETKMAMGKPEKPFHMDLKMGQSPRDDVWVVD